MDEFRTCSCINIRKDRSVLRRRGKDCASNLQNLYEGARMRMKHRRPARSHALLCLFWFTWQLSDGYGTHRTVLGGKHYSTVLVCVSRTSKAKGNVRATHIQKKARVFSLALTAEWQEVHVISLLKYGRSIIGRTHRYRANRAKQRCRLNERCPRHASEGSWE